MLSWLLNGCSGGGGGGGSGGASLLYERSQDRNPWGQQLCSAFHSTPAERGRQKLSQSSPMPSNSSSTADFFGFFAA